MVRVNSSHHDRIEMTNFEYIKQNITELDLAYYEFPNSVVPKDKPDLFSDKIYWAFNKWAESASSNHGNMAKGIHHGNTEIKEDPSIWAWHRWIYPDGKWRNSGRPSIVAFLVWLSKQYDPEDWNDD